MNKAEKNTILKVWAGYLLLDLITFFVWTTQHRFQVTGDEPHHLVMADSIVTDKIFELSKTYQREANNRAFLVRA